MIRRLVFEQSIIETLDMEEIVKIFPELKDSFTRRKEFSEFFFKPTNVDLKKITQLEALSSASWDINIDAFEIKVNV